jgi:F-type H+-transporting ATPase subunit epsilon
MSDFKLNIYTPNGVVINGLECSELTIPTTTGEINVLKDHTHVLTELDTGILLAKTAMGDRHFSMTSGLAKVLGQEITILSTTSEKAEDIDIERAKSAKAKAESRLSEIDKLSSIEQIKFKRKLDRANIRIKLRELNK